KNKYTDEYTYQRQAIHANIIADILGDLDSEDYPYLNESKMLFTGGPPASGKNTMLSIYLDDEELVETTPIIIDPDNIKKMLPEYIITSVDEDYAEMISDYLHAESGDIAWKCFEEVLRRDKAFGVFVVTLTDVLWSRKMISMAKESGFEVDILFTYAPLEVCIEREAKRKEETRRGVPLHILKQKHREFSENFGIIAAMGDFVSLYNNSADISEEINDDELIIYSRQPGEYFLRRDAHIDEHLFRY